MKKLSPKFAEEWRSANSELNPELKLLPENALPIQKVPVYWRCPKCNILYIETIANRVAKGDCCPNCNSEVPVPKSRIDKIYKDFVSDAYLKSVNHLYYGYVVSVG